VGLAVPHDAAESRHLLGGRLERVHEGARAPGDALLRAVHRDHHRLRGRPDRRPHRERTDLLMASAAAPPFVSYSTMSEAVVPASEWPYLYASLQAHKAHVQEYPGCERLEAWVAVDDDGSMRIHCYTTWDTP